MPFRDGTGPVGKGPLTGRGLRNCTFGGRKEKNGSFRIRKRDGLGLAIVGMIVNDIANPDGITRKLVQKLTHRISGFVQEHKSMAGRKERQQISNQKLLADSRHDNETSI